MKKAYQYFFYKLYQLFQQEKFDRFAKWKAIFSLDCLWAFIVIQSIVYYSIYIDRYFKLSTQNYDILILMIFIVLPNYFIFDSGNKWREIVIKFDELPKKKLGDWIVYSIVVLIMGSLFYSFYLMSQIDWKLYN